MIVAFALIYSFFILVFYAALSDVRPFKETSIYFRSFLALVWPVLLAVSFLTKAGNKL